MFLNYREELSASERVFARCREHVISGMRSEGRLGYGRERVEW